MHSNECFLEVSRIWIYYVNTSKKDAGTPAVSHQKRKHFFFHERMRASLERLNESLRLDCEDVENEISSYDHNRDDIESLESILTRIQFRKMLTSMSMNVSKDTPTKSNPTTSTTTASSTPTPISTKMKSMMSMNASNDTQTTSNPTTSTTTASSTPTPISTKIKSMMSMNASNDTPTTSIPTTSTTSTTTASSTPTPTIIEKNITTLTKTTSSTPIRNVVQKSIDNNKLLFMSETNILIVPHALTYTKKQIEIWKKRLREKGAEISEKYSSSVTHVVLCPNVKREFVMSLQSDWKLSDDAHFVKSSWILQSLRRKKMETVTDHLWERKKTKTTTKSRKRSRSSTEQNRRKKKIIKLASKCIGKLDHDARARVLKRAPWLKTIQAKISASGLRTFVCQQDDGGNMNSHITNILNQMSEVRKIQGKPFRENSYKKVSNVFKSLQIRIESVRDFRSLVSDGCVKGIGDSMRENIEEILETGTMKELHQHMNDEIIKAEMTIGKIWGVGIATAKMLVHQFGMRTIEDIRKECASKKPSSEIREMFERNSRTMKVGLDRYEDFLKRIPRKEANSIYRVVRREAEKIGSGVVSIAAGSYRRGCTSSGDVDVLITYSDGIETPTFDLPKLIRSLHQIGFLTHDLTRVKKNMRSYMGVCRLSKSHVDDPTTIVSGTFRRIDIKFYPRNQFAFALLYFTGSDFFNRSMRLYAKKSLGLSLSDTHLVEDTGFKKNGREVPCDSEREIFAALGLVYRDPTQRNCSGVELAKYDETLVCDDENV